MTNDIHYCIIFLIFFRGGTYECVLILGKGPVAISRWWSQSTSPRWGIGDYCFAWTVATLLKNAMHIWLLPPRKSESTCGFQSTCPHTDPSHGGTMLATFLTMKASPASRPWSIVGHTRESAHVIIITYTSKYHNSTKPINTCRLCTPSTSKSKNMGHVLISDLLWYLWFLSFCKLGVQLWLVPAHSKEATNCIP